MEFGIFVTPNPQRVAVEAKFAEEHGFTHAWFVDDPMLGAGDVFACMALAATTTRTIKLCAGIAAASNRIAPVTANAIATVHALAPSRVILGYGSGSGTLGSLGLPPLKMRTVRHELTALQELLRDGEGAYETNRRRTRTRFFNRDLEFTRLVPRIPVYVAAAAPKMAALAGELGDGLINFGPAIPELVTQLLGQARTGAQGVGRDLRQFPCVWMPLLCVLAPGEAIDSPRVINRTGSGVLTTLKIFSGVPDFEALPPQLRTLVQSYAAQFTTTAKEELHLKVLEGIYTLRADERRWVTPEAIRATTLVGARDEVIARLKALEDAAVTQIAVFPGFDNFHDAAVEVSRELIGRL